MVIALCNSCDVAHLTPDELQTLLDKLDDVCRQARELQKQLRQQMIERARRDQPARRGLLPQERRSRKRTAPNG